MSKIFIKYKHFITCRNNEVHLTNSNKHHSCLTFIMQINAENPSPIIVLTLIQIEENSALPKQLPCFVLKSEGGGWRWGFLVFFFLWQPSLYSQYYEYHPWDTLYHFLLWRQQTLGWWTVLFLKTVTLSMNRLMQNFKKKQSYCSCITPAW